MKELLQRIDNYNVSKWRLIGVLTILSFLISFLFFDRRELMSEYLIVNSLYINFSQGFSDWAGIFFYDGQPYTSQLGIHAFVFSIPLFFGVKVSSLYMLSLILLVTVFFYYLVVSLTIEIKKQHGGLPSVLFLAFMVFNPHILLNSGNLYWLYFLYILPFYFSLKYYNAISSRKFYFFLTLLFIVKFSVNFEYASTVVISGLIPIALKSRLQFVESMSYLVKKGVWVFTASLISFGLILTFLTFQLSHLGNDATSQLEKVISSYISGGKNEPHFMKYENVIIERNEMYKSIYITKSKNSIVNSGWANVIEARNTYEGYTSLLNYISFQNVTSSFYSIQFLLFSLASLFLIYSYMTDLDKYASSLNALLIAILGSFSWIIIMPLHFYLHSIYWRGISDIVLMFPFYTIVVMLFGFRYRSLFFSVKKASNISTV